MWISWQKPWTNPFAKCRFFWTFFKTSLFRSRKNFFVFRILKKSFFFVFFDQNKHMRKPPVFWQKPGTNSRKYDSITPVMSKLHWLPVHSRIIFKLLLLVYKALNGKAPSYISSLLSHRKCSRSLRSSGQELLTVPLAKLKTYGDRAFGIAAPRQWNSLPLSIRKSLSIAIFKSVNFWTFGTSCFYSLERRFFGSRIS